MLLRSPPLALNHPPGQCLKLRSPPGSSAPQQTPLLLKFFGVLILSFLYRTIMECQYFSFFQCGYHLTGLGHKPSLPPISGLKLFLTWSYWSSTYCIFRGILLSLQRALSGTHSKANIKSDMRSIDHIYFNSAIVQTPGPRLRYWSFEWMDFF